jgi:RNA polymerase sigma factor (sigma-70 family)
VSADPGVEDLLRALAPRVLGTLVRRYGQFDRCEDAVQEALLAAAVQWPAQGLPDNPGGWLVTVAGRRLVDRLRSDEASRRREEAVAARAPAGSAVVAGADEGPPGGEGEDDTLRLLFLCCHPALTPASQVALTLRAVGGLTTAQIARAFLVPEATMAQRISRAKAQIRTAGATFALPAPDERAARLAVVLNVLYLVFNEGYTTSSGPELASAALTGEAIRLTREVRRLLPDDGEVAGLLALMLLTDARRTARTGDGGRLIPLAEQDRTRWDRAAIAEGVALISETLPRAPLGPYQLQAAIAAIHDEAPTAAKTDWPQVLALYDMLDRSTDNPMVTLNRAVALAMVRGPEAGLALLAPLDGDARVAGHHRLAAVRAHLHELAGDQEAARAAYREAARRTTSLPEQRYLDAKARSVGPPSVTAMDWKIELVTLPVSDVDRAKAFYVDQAGFNADHDHQVSDEMRFVQLTPPGSACSICIGKGMTDAAPGSVQGMQIVVEDAEAARAELVSRGVDASEVQTFPWGKFTFFKDPDGNAWAVQQIPPR